MTAGVVVIGGGVVGCSVAYHLARSGLGAVLVVDRGGGSTERATGGFRAQFATAMNVKLSLLSLEKLQRFADETGVEPGYAPCGYLFVARTLAELGKLRNALEVQRAAGYYAAREVSTEGVLVVNPHLAPETIIGGSFSPTDGFLRPLELQRGYREAATRLGVRFMTTTVRALALRAGKIFDVSTDAGTIACSAVVNAAGPWAAAVARLAGVEVPIVPLRRQVAVTDVTDALPPSMPMTIFADGFHLRVRDGRVLLLQPSEPAWDAFDVSVDPAWLEDVLTTARRRIPCLREVHLDSSYAGLYEMSPDEHAILGWAPGVENLLLVNGSSGHGVMHAPALGQLAAELLTIGEARTLDISTLRPSRFAEGRGNPISSLL
jgi:sarcosine oxidase, subunit beta